MEHHIRFARNIYEYMDNVVDERKARKLDSISLARCFCFMLTETASHKIFFAVSQCLCFCCCIKNLIRYILIKRNEQRLLLVLNVRNFNDLSDNEVLNKLLSSK